jgi:hypothetical protein
LSAAIGESKLFPIAHNREISAPLSEQKKSSPLPKSASAKAEHESRGSPPLHSVPVALFNVPVPATAMPLKIKEENVLKIRDCCVELSCYEQQLRRRWPGIKYCCVSKRKSVLRIVFNSPEAFSAARAGISAATIVIESRTAEVHDEDFVKRDLASHGFESCLLSVVPMARQR